MIFFDHELIEVYNWRVIMENQLNFGHQDLVGTNTKQDSKPLWRFLPLSAPQNQNRYARFTFIFILSSLQKRPISHLKSGITKVAITGTHLRGSSNFPKTVENLRTTFR